MRRIEILDTTLRDGAQARGVSFSVEDKLAIAATLDSLGIPLIELGSPATSPREAEVFRRIDAAGLQNARICAFGSTRRKGGDAKEDLAPILAAGAPVAVIFGKAWLYHVREVLATTPEENLRMIEDSVRFLHASGVEVIFDAEHYFDGAAEDAGYASEVLRTALDAGARTAVLCDTNGGTFPDAIAKNTSHAVSLFGDRIGIHCHDDCGCAVAGAIAAVQAGAVHVQGTLLGFGERCGNTTLSTLIPDLQLKLGYACIPEDCLSGLTFSARRIADVANISLNRNSPYVGANAFSHKAGMHADGVVKNTRTFEHIDPALVGNSRHFVTSELAGRNLILRKLQSAVPGLTRIHPRPSVSWMS